MREVPFKFPAFITIILLEIFIVLIFLTNSNTNWSKFFKSPHPTCSVLNSTVVRHLIQKRWSPILSRYGVGSVPIQCPLNLERDLYGGREKYKKKSSSHWTCGKCGKRFYGEAYLDLHLQRRHSEILHNGDDGVCLASSCEVLRCDVLSSSLHLSGNEEESSTDLTLWDPSSILLTPSPPHSSSSTSHTNKLTQLGPGESPLSIIGGGGGVKIEEVRREECREEEGEEQREKCTQLIWDCLKGLITQFEPQEFRQLLDELESVSCGCYFKSSEKCVGCYSKLKGGLRPFLIVFGSLLISLCLALAYYFAWVYTQNSEEGGAFYSGVNKKTDSTHSQFTQISTSETQAANFKLRNKTSHI